MLLTEIQLTVDVNYSMSDHSISQIMLMLKAPMSIILAEVL